MIMAGPTLYAWFRPRPWATIVAVVAFGVGLAGLCGAFITMQRMRRMEQQRALKTQNDWKQLTPRGFEEHVSDLFKARGYKAQVVGGTADGGLDIKLQKDGATGIVQCKRYERNVGVKAIREFCAVATRAGCAEAYFITTSGYTRDALNWAKNEPIILIDGDTLISWAQDAKFGAYAAPAPKPPLYFTTTQWAILTALATGAVGVLGLLAGMVMGL